MHRFFPIIGLLVAVSGQAHHLDHEQALRMSRQGEILPVQQLLDSAIASHPDARLLDMKLRHKHGRYLYKLHCWIAAARCTSCISMRKAVSWSSKKHTRTEHAPVTGGG